MGNYDDIINLPHHVSAVRPPMPVLDRAAQFSPFAALTGYGAAIDEAARLTDARPVLDDSRKEELDGKLQIIREHLSMAPEIAVTYFVPDGKKEGGSFLRTAGIVKKLDNINHKIVMANGTAISMEDIYEIRGSLLDDMENI